MKDINKRQRYLNVLLREFPIITFFIYLFYLSWWSHEREHRMLDYTMIYDHWWYFYHRLREGSIAQWNPYSLFGRIAVQWNFIPVSIFSLFFLLFEPTLMNYHVCNVIGTWMAMLSIYIMGRMLGYGRYYPLLSVPLLMNSGYRYYIHNFVPLHYIISFPLAVAVFFKTINKNFSKFCVNKWIWVILLFSVSLMGINLQYIIYSFILIVLTFLIVNLFPWRKNFNIWIVGLGVISYIAVLIVWQFPFLLTSSLNLDRVSVGFNPFAILDGNLWKWVFLSLILQAPLIFVIFNLLVVYIIKCFPKLNVLLNKVQAFAIILTEFIILRFLLIYLYKYFNISEGSIRQITGLQYFSFHRWLTQDILSFWHDIIPVSIVLVLNFIKKKNIGSHAYFRLLIILFAGFYISEYSWQRWQIYLNMPFFFWHPIVASFITLGAVNLWNKKRYWVIVILVIYHLITETGSFFLQEVFGFPWLASRAAISELPFQVILLLESISYLFYGILSIVEKLKPDLNFVRAINPAVNIIIVIFVFLNIERLMIPGEKVIIDGRKAYQTYDTFPFSRTILHQGEQNKKKNQWIYEALQNAENVKQKGKQVNPWHRVYVSDEILVTKEEQAYKFMPAYSMTHNTAPVYAGEIPKALKDIFRGEDPPIKEAIHYELAPLVQAYFISQNRRGGNVVYVFPHEKKEPLYKELMAEEGSNTPRAFLSARVIKLDQQVEEYRYLKDVLAKGGNVVDQIMTSDSSFEPAYTESSLPLKYSLAFERDDPEHIVFKADANQSAYLALLDLYSPGWRAYIDGVEHRIYRGYIGTRFIAIPEGRHRVEFKYRVPYLIPAMVVSGMGWIIMLILMFRNIFAYNKM